MATVGPINKSSPTTQFQMWVDILYADVPNNRTRMRMTLRNVQTGSPAGSSNPSRYLGPGTQAGYFNNANYLTHSGNPFLPAAGSGAIRWTDTFDFWIDHSADGRYNNGNAVSISFNINYGTINEWHGSSITIPRIARVPVAPTLSPATNRTPTSFRVPFALGDNMGAAITQSQVQWSTTSNFSSIAWTDTIPGSPGSGWSEPSGAGVSLIPGTQYWVRMRSLNSTGWSSWSNVVSSTTLPSTPPGISVSPSLSGAESFVALTPPGGVSGVSLYKTERRVTGTTGPVTAVDGPTSPVTHSVLTPRQSYDYRATAVIGGYEAPWSAWVTLVQPQPSTAPGDYFDGSTAAGADVTYSWVGTAGSSASIATAPGVLGWAIAGYEDGGAAVLYRATSDLVGPHAARVVVKNDCGVGVRVGQRNDDGFRSPALPFSVYNGSMVFRASRTQRMAAELTWLDETEAVISRSLGDPVIVPANTTTTLGVEASAPEGTAWVVVDSIDVAGSGHSPWLGGESFLLDAAMITLGGPYPYFDGSFPAAGQFVFEWEDTPHNSPSLRLLSDTFIDPLQDPDCIVVPSAPRPPIVPNSCIIDVGIWRRYWYEIPNVDIREWFETVPSIRVRTGASEEHQIRVRFYANPFGRALSTIDPEDYCSEQIVSYLPPRTVLTLDGISERSWAEVNGGAAVPANHLLYGTDGRPASWPLLECGISYYMAIDVPTDGVEGNVDADYDLVVRY